MRQLKYQKADNAEEKNYLQLAALKKDTHIRFRLKTMLTLLAILKKISYRDS